MSSSPIAGSTIVAGPTTGGTGATASGAIIASTDEGFFRLEGVDPGTVAALMDEAAYAAFLETVA